MAQGKMRFDPVLFKVLSGDNNRGSRLKRDFYLEALTRSSCLVKDRLGPPFRIASCAFLRV